MSGSINLIFFGKSGPLPSWGAGRVFSVDPDAGQIEKLLEAENGQDVRAWLFWDEKFPLPSENKILELLAQPFDVWHAGLKLGLQGTPGMVHYVSPLWMMNCDPDKEIDSTSWRLSLNACLVRAEVLRKMGGPRTDFRTFEAAGLEMGHRYLTSGVFVRHCPSLLSGIEVDVSEKIPIPHEDELRFIFQRCGKFWARWAAFRAVKTGYASWSQISVLLPLISRWSAPPDIIYERPEPEPEADVRSASVSVLIPTLNRYQYLRKILGQLEDQTVPPIEVIVVDQTPEGKRDRRIFFHSKLPLKVIYQSHPGQCASRNAGLLHALGDYILFLDDDDEIFPDLIEKHLKSLLRFKTRVSSGVAHEAGIRDLPKNFTYPRASDVFPTNNTMIHRNVLEKSGLFDLAYDRKSRADWDLGMRIYLSGEPMVLNSGITVIHHHASRGGLRTHKARVQTYAGSRKGLFKRHLMSDSEMYLGLRYFSQYHVREAVWLSVFGTFALKGPWLKRVLKFFTGLLALPDTVSVVRGRWKIAEQMLKHFPKIPKFKSNRPCAS